MEETSLSTVAAVVGALVYTGSQMWHHLRDHQNVGLVRFQALVRGYQVRQRMLHVEQFRVLMKRLSKYGETDLASRERCKAVHVAADFIAKRFHPSVRCTLPQLRLNYLIDAVILSSHKPHSFKLDNNLVRIRTADENDIEAVVELEQFVNPPYRVGSEAIWSRFEATKRFGGILLLEIDNVVRGCLFAIRTNLEGDLNEHRFRCRYKTLYKLHRDTGNTIQWIHFIVHSEFRQFASLFHAAAFEYSFSTPNVTQVCAVTHCVNFADTDTPSSGTRPGQCKTEEANRTALPQPTDTGSRIRMLECYVDKSIHLDQNLFFHTSRGAKVVGVVPYFNPADVNNATCGVLVGYSPEITGGTKHQDDVSTSIGNNPEAETVLLQVQDQLVQLDVIQDTCYQFLSGSPPVGLNPKFWKLPWFELGFDSLSLVTLHSAVCDVFQLEMEVSTLFAKNTPRKLCEHIVTIKTPPQVEIPTRLRSRRSTIQNTPTTTGGSTNGLTAVVGIGLRFPNPIGTNSGESSQATSKHVVNNDIWGPDELWAALFAADTHDAPPSGKIQNPDMFDADFFGLSQAEAKAMHAQQRWALETSYLALRDAGFVGNELPAYLEGQRVGVFVGAWDHHSPWEKNSVFDLTGHSNTIIANRISYILDLHGPSVVVDTACSSSLVALNIASNSLQSFECDIAIVVGVNYMSNSTTSMLVKGGFLSPTGRCHSFDARADGYARSEGAAAIVLMRGSDVAEMSVRAFVCGSGVNQDGRTVNLNAPNPEAQVDLVLSTCQRAGVQPQEISFVETHGTGTKLGDPIEASALQQTYGVSRDTTDVPCWLSSAKSQFGHMEGTAGMLGLIKAILCLQHRAIPGNPFLMDENPLIPFDKYGIRPVRNQVDLPEQGTLFAAVSSFGFGGTNSHVILGSSDGSVTSLNDQIDHGSQVPVEEQLPWNPVWLPFTRSEEAQEVRSRRRSSMSSNPGDFEEHPPLQFGGFEFEKVTSTTQVGHIELVLKPTSKDLAALVAEHRVGPVSVFPATLMVELVNQALAKELDVGNFQLKDIEFIKFMEVEAIHDLQTQVSVIVKEVASKSESVTTDCDLLATLESSNKGKRRQVHATMKVVVNPNYHNLTSLAQRRENWNDLYSNFQSNPAIQSMSGGSFYDSIGNDYGGMFRAITNIKRAPTDQNSTHQELLACISVDSTFLEQESHGNQLSVLMNGVLMDAACQAGMAMFPLAKRLRPILVKDIQRIEFQNLDSVHDTSFEAFCHVTLSRSTSGTIHSDSLDIDIYDATGEPLASLIGCTIGSLPKTSNTGLLSMPFICYDVWEDSSIVAQPKKSTTMLGNSSGPSTTNKQSSFNDLDDRINSLHTIRWPKDCATLHNQVLDILAQSKGGKAKEMLILSQGLDGEQGYIRTLRKETPGWRIWSLRCLQSDCPEIELNGFLTNHKGDLDFQYSSENKRWQTPRLVPYVPSEKEVEPYDSTGGAYVVTGGLGAIGKLVAHELQQRGAHTVYLLSRSATQLPEEFMHASKTTFRLIQCDVSDMLTLRTLVFEPLIAKFGSVRAVFHCAGVLADATIPNLTAESFEKVFRPKVQGALNILKLSKAEYSVRGVDDETSQTSGDVVRDVVLFSSVTSNFGSIGQGNYGAANDALDAIALQYAAEHETKHRGTKVTSIRWGPWGGGHGMAADEMTGIRFAREGLASVEPDEGIGNLFNLLQDTSLPCRVVTMCPIVKTRLPKLPYFENIRLDLHQEQHVSQGIGEGSFSRMDAKEQLATFKLHVSKVAGLLGISNVPDDRPWREVGLDSLSMVEFRNILQQRLRENYASDGLADIVLSDAILFNYPTLEALCQHLVSVTTPTPILPPPSLLLATQATSANEPLAIIGVSCRLPGGNSSPSRLLEYLYKGGDAMGTIPTARFNWRDHFDPEIGRKGKIYTNAGSFIDAEHFDNKRFAIADAEVRTMDPQQRLVLELGLEALQSSGYSMSDLVGKQVGAFVGCMNSDWNDLLLEDSNDSPFSASGSCNSILANRFSFSLGLTGPSITLDTACSSSLVAIDCAVASIRKGDCEMAVVQGVNLMLSSKMYERECAARMLSPNGRCATFSKHADGYARGEGCAAIVLKPLSQARKHNDPIWAVVSGTAVNQDGRSANLTSPHGPSQERVIRTALQRARITPDQVSFIEAHGTGTPLGDPIEVEALSNVFAQRQGGKVLEPREHPLIIGALKSNIGHTEGAAGIAGVVKAIMCLRHQSVPRNHHCASNEDINPKVASVLVDGEMALAMKDEKLNAITKNNGVLHAGVSSFGFGGTNAHVILSSVHDATPDNDLVRIPSEFSRNHFPWKQVQHSSLLRSENNREWIVKLEKDHVSYLRGHHAGTLAIAPATLHIMIASSISSSVFGTESIAITHFSPESMLELPEADDLSLIATIDRNEDTHQSFQLSIAKQQKGMDSNNAETSVVATMLVETSTPRDLVLSWTEAKEIRNGVSNSDIVSGSAFYNAIGNQYQQEFKRIKNICKASIDGQLYAFSTIDYKSGSDINQEPAPLLRASAWSDNVIQTCCILLPAFDWTRSLYVKKVESLWCCETVSEFRSKLFCVARRNSNGSLDVTAYCDESPQHEAVFHIQGLSIGRFETGISGLLFVNTTTTMSNSASNDTFMNASNSKINVIESFQRDGDEYHGTLIRLHKKILSLLEGGKLELGFVLTDGRQGQLGYLRTLNREFTQWKLIGVHCESNFKPSRQELLTCSQQIPSSERELYFDGEARTWNCPRLSKYFPRKQTNLNDSTGGAYVVTGGLGAIGKLVAHELQQRGAHTVYLLSRSATQLPEEFMHAPKTTFRLIQCDVSDMSTLRTLVFEPLIAKFGSVRAVFHCAGVLADATIPNLTAESFEKVFRPKVQGALNILKLSKAEYSVRGVDDETSQTSGDVVRDVVLFSSVTSNFGSIGQGNYGAANDALDAIALQYAEEHETKHRGTKVTSIRWGPWGGGHGMASSDSQALYFAKDGICTLEPSASIEALFTVLEQDVPLAVLTICPVVSHRLPFAGYFAALRGVSRDKQPDVAKRTSKNGSVHQVLTTNQIEILLAKVAAQVGIEFSADSFDERPPWSDLGMDSLSTIEYRNLLGDQLADIGISATLSPTLLFTFPNPAELRDHLLSIMQDESKLNESGSSKPIVDPPQVSNTQTVEESNAPINETDISSLVAVTGIACQLPGGSESPLALYNFLCQDGDAMRTVPISRFDVSQCYNPNRSFSKSGFTYTNKGAFLNDIDMFDAEFFGIPAKEVATLDPQQRVALTIAFRAFENSGFSKKDLRGSNCGVFVGSMTNDWAHMQAREGIHSPYSATGYSSSIIANRISYTLGLTGPSIAIDTACSSSLVAIHTAAAALERGDCEFAVVVGVNLILSSHFYVSECAARMLSPNGRCATFSKHADGYARGEGCAAIVLKPLSQARKHNDPIWAVVSGTAVNQDGRSANLTSPHGPSQERVIRTALQRARITPDQVSFVEAHGTGTPLGDPIEVEALSNVFAQRQGGKVLEPREHPLIIGALKSNIGHTEGAAGIAGVVKAIMCLRHQSVPRNHHCASNEDINPKVASVLVDGEMALAMKDEKLNAITKNNGVLHAGVSSFGFGGTNAHVILSVFEQDVLGSSELETFTPSVLRPIQHTWNIQVMPNKDTVNANRPTTPLGGTEPTLALYNQNDQDIASTDLAWDAEFDTFLLMNWFRSSQYSFSPPVNFCSLSTYKSDDMAAKTHVMVNATGQNIWLAIEATQKLCTITHLHVVYVTDEEACRTGFLGFTRSLRLEYGSWQVQCVILTEGKSEFPTNMDLFQLAIPKNVDDIWVTPNSNGRYKLFERKLVEIEQLQTTNSPLDRVASSGILNLDGVYLVTGGLSGIGKVLGDWLLQNGARKVIRISRRGEIVVGSDLMDETPPSWWNETSVSLSCDVTMKSNFATLLRNIETMCKFDNVCIRGVIHCAGVMERCTFSNLTTQQLSQHYQVKVGSARTLHEFFRDPIRSASLEFFVLCSSLSSLVGYHSGSAYSVSNAALDELSKEGVSLGLPSISIQWGRWTQVGMAASQRSTQGSKYGITNQAGCCALERVLNIFQMARTEGVAIDPCIAVADRDWRGALGNMKRTPSILRNVLPDDANAERVSEHHVVHTDASRKTEPNIELISNNQMPGSTAALNSKQEPQQHFGSTAHVTEKEHRDRLEQLENERVWFETIVSLLTELGIPAAQLAQFNMSTSWMEVGLDSLALVDLRNSIEDNMKNFTMNNEAFLSDTLLLDHATPRALHDFLQPRNSIVSIPNENHTFKFDLATGLSDRSLDFQPMAITGMSLRLPGAGCDSPFGFWDFLIRGGDGIVEIPQERFDVDAVYDPKLGSINKMYVKRAGLLDDIINFDNELFNITAVEASEMDPHQRIALEVAYEALTNANIIGPNAPSGPSRTGVFVAAQNTEFSAMQSLEGSQRANRSVGPFSATGQSLSIIANRISYTLDLVGPSVSIDTACSSSLVALDVAAKAVRDGDCDNAIVLAVELHLSPSRYISTCAARMLSPRGVCATFSDTADGYVRGEGCAAIVIEPLSIAASNNTPVWSVVRSVAINQDGKSANLTSPNGPAQELVIRRSLQRADLEPDQLDMVEAHGTGTALGDPQEIQALGQVFSGRNRPLVIGAAKSNVGHLEAAAGIVGIIKASLCTLFRMSPPNLHCDTLNPRIVKLPALKASQLVFPVSSTPLGVVDQPVYVGVSSFGFGGTNAHAILQSYDPECIPSHSKVQFRRVPFPIREYCHPFLGSPLAPVRTTEDVCFSWECKWSEQILEYLSQHRVGRVPLVPGTCYIEMVGAAVRQHFGTNQAYTLSNIQFESILYLNSTIKRSRQVFTEFFRRKSFMKDDPIEVRILSKDPNVDEDDNRTLHATLQLHLGETSSSEDPNNEPIDVAKVKQRCGDFMECGENFYSQLGNQYIGEFTCLKRVWKSNHETLGEIVFEEENVPSYLRHCALLDVASHAIMAGLPVAERSKPLYAAAAGEYQVPTKRTAIVRTAWSHVTVDESGCINCSIYDADTKELVARMCGQKVGTFKKLPEARWKPDKNMSVYNETWQSVNASVAHEPKDSFNYLEAVELSVIQFHTKVLNLMSFKPTKDTIVLVPTTNVSGVQGYLRSVIAERPELRFRMVHIDLHGFDDSNEIVRHLPESIPSSKGEELLYLASTSTWKCRRLIPSAQHHNLQVSSTPEWCTLLKSGPLKGDCVITGGLGSVGKQLTDIILLEDLLDRNARLILLTRRSESQLDDDKFSTLLTHGLDSRKVEIVRCDVGDEESMPQLFSMFPNISAIFHCAGVLRDGALEEITETSFRDVFTPKVGCLLGVLASMDQGLGRKLKLVVSFSSISASQGSPGQANYAAANAALDGITEKLNLERTYPQVRFLSLNFGPLLPDGVIQEGTGMVTEEVLNSIYRRSGVKVTDTKYALKYMLSVLPLGADQESQQDDDRQLDSLQVKLQETSSQFKMRETPGQEGVHSSFNVCTLDTYRLPAGNKLYDLIRTTSSHTEVQEDYVDKFKRLVENGVDNTGEWIEVALQSLFNIMDQLGFPQPDDQRTTWREAGLDSLTMVEFRNTLAEKYENVLALSDAVLFNFPTPLLLATMMVEKLKAQFGQCDMPKAPAHVSNAQTNDIRVSNDPKNHVQPHSTLGNPEPMAVIASSCVFPGGVTTPQQLVELLRRGKRVMTEIPTERFDWVKHFDPEPGSEFKTYVKHGAFIRDVDAFDSERFPFTDVEVSAMDPQQRLAIETCARAWDFLSTNGSNVSTNCGVFAGVMTNDWLMCHARKSNTPANPYTATGYSGAIIANRISYALGLTGPSMVIDTACSSSLVAVDTACNAIRRGQCDCAIVTGVNLLLSEDNFVAESAARMLSPKGRCETFGETADGYARGEGCGAVILKPLSAALRDGDPILATIAGSAVNQDGRSANLVSPNGLAQVQVIQRAIAEAGIQPQDIGMIEAHGTGTPLGDPLEVEALVTVFGDESPSRAYPLIVGALKSCIGHLEGASGIAGLIKAIECVRRGTCPQNIRESNLNPRLNALLTRCRMVFPTEEISIPSSAQDGSKYIGVSGFGFGGTNAHVIVKSPPTSVHQTDDSCVALNASRRKFQWMQLGHPMFDIQGRSYSGTSRLANLHPCIAGIFPTSLLFDGLLHAAKLSAGYVGKLENVKFDLLPGLSHESMLELNTSQSDCIEITMNQGGKSSVVSHALIVQSHTEFADGHLENYTLTFPTSLYKLLEQEGKDIAVVRSTNTSIMEEFSPYDSCSSTDDDDEFDSSHFYDVLGYRSMNQISPKLGEDVVSGFTFQPQVFEWMIEIVKEAFKDQASKVDLLLMTPLKIGKLTAHDLEHLNTRPLFCHVSNAMTAKSSFDGFKADVALYDNDRQVVLSLQDIYLTLTPVGSPLFETSFVSVSNIENQVETQNLAFEQSKVAVWPASSALGSQLRFHAEQPDSIAEVSENTNLLVLDFSTLPGDSHCETNQHPPQFVCDWENTLKAAVEALQNTLQVLDSSKSFSAHVCVVTERAYRVRGDEYCRPDMAAIWGIVKSISQEVADIHFSIIDVPTTSHTMDTRLQLLVWKGIAAQYLKKESMISMLLLRQQGGYFKPHLRPSRLQFKLAHVLSQGNSSGSVPTMSSLGTYIVTGGLGGLGLLTAAWLLEHGAKYILLLSRSGKPREGIATQDSERILLEKVKTWPEAKVETVACDVSDFQDIKLLFETYMSDNSNKTQFPKCTGIFHSAGVMSDGMLMNQTWDSFKRVLHPKLGGAINLHLATEELGYELEHFVVYSSLAGLFGAPGQSNHSAGNAALDSFVQWRKAQGKPATAIQWGGWSDIGHAANHSSGDMITSRGLGMISNEMGKASLNAICNKSRIVAVNPINWPVFLSAYQDHSLLGFFAKAFQNSIASREFKPAQKSTETPKEKQSSNEYENKKVAIRDWLTSFIRSRHMEVPEGTNSWTGVGLDSLGSIEMGNGIRKTFGVRLQPNFHHTYKTLSSLQEKLVSELSTSVDSVDRNSTAGGKVLPPSSSSSKNSKLSRGSNQLDGGIVGNSSGHTNYSPWSDRVLMKPLYRVFCFAYAGGDPSVYACWMPCFPSTYQICPVPLPGFGRPQQCDSIQTLAASIADTLPTDTKYILAGQCLGAIVAYEVCRQISQRALPLPESMYVMAASAPNLYAQAIEQVFSGDLLHDSTFFVKDDRLQETSSLSGVSFRDLEFSALNEDEQLEMLQRLRNIGFFQDDRLVDALRQDKSTLDSVMDQLACQMRLAQRYTYVEKGPPLPIPLTTFFGGKDTTIPDGYPAEWSKFTSEQFELIEFSNGGHYLLEEYANDITKLIQKK